MAIDIAPRTLGPPDMTETRIYHFYHKIFTSLSSTSTQATDWHNNMVQYNLPTPKQYVEGYN